MKKQIFARITKVDAENRLVYGVAAAEELDKSGEIFDYEGSKPYFEKWSEQAMKMSIPAVEAFGPLAISYGNVREMHTTKAAGKFQEPISFDDESRLIRVCSKVTDDSAWSKVCDGVYTGFSIGGDYIKRWDDPAVKWNGKPAKRYIAAPVETSLVDNPCIPSATFSYIVKDAPVEMRKFQSVEMMAEDIPAETARVCAELAAPETRKSATAAAIRLLKRAKELSVDASGLAKAYVTQFGNPGLVKRLDLAKSLYDVMDIAGVLMTLNYCRLCLTNEAEYEGDGSLIPAKLTEVVETLSAILVELAAEESSELTAESTTKTAGTTALQKGTEEDMTAKFYKKYGPLLDALVKAAEPTEPGVSKSLTNEEIVTALGGVDSVVKMASHLKEIGKHVGNIRAAHSKMAKSLDELDPQEPEGGDEPEEDSGADKTAKPAIAKAAVQSDALVKMQQQIDDLTKRLEMIPAPSKVAINPQPVSKSADSGGAEPEPIDPKDPQAALKAMKAVHSGGPIPIRK